MSLSVWNSWKNYVNLNAINLTILYEFHLNDYYSNFTTAYVLTHEFKARKDLILFKQSNLIKPFAWGNLFFTLIWFWYFFLLTQ